MRGYPERHADVGKLVDLGYVTLTVAPVPISTTSRPVVSITIQNTEAQGNDILVGDNMRQSMYVFSNQTYTVRAADASQVYMRSNQGTVIVAVHILEP